MTGLRFADTNIVLYSIGKDSGKKEAARSILALRPVISAQVVNEALNVCLRRFAFTPEQAYAFADALMRRAVQLAEEIGHPSLEGYCEALADIRAKLKAQ